jgi:hypothetical protein
MSKVLARSLALALSVLPASAIFESCQAQSFAQAETKAIKPMQGGEPIPASGIYYCGNVDAPIYGGNASAIEYFAPSVNSGARQIIQSLSAGSREEWWPRGIRLAMRYTKWSNCTELKSA